MMSLNQSMNFDRSSSRGKTENRAQNLGNSADIQWKSEGQQQIYSSKLVHALQKLRLGEEMATNRVRDAANRVLAATAKGGSRWSRAILINRLKLKKFMKKRNELKRRRTGVTVITTGNSRLKKKSKFIVCRLKSKELPAFQRKARLLGRLIPGCQKQPVQVVLEEAIDYIPALEMQVGAMSTLVARLTTNGSTVVPSDGHVQPSSTGAYPN